LRLIRHEHLNWANHAKLADDQQPAVDDERFAVNVTALRTVQPPDPAESGALAVAL